MTTIKAPHGGRKAQTKTSLEFLKRFLLDCTILHIGYEAPAVDYTVQKRGPKVYVPGHWFLHVGEPNGCNKRVLILSDFGVSKRLKIALPVGNHGRPEETGDGYDRR